MDTYQVSMISIIYTLYTSNVLTVDKISENIICRTNSFELELDYQGLCLLIKVI